MTPSLLDFPIFPPEVQTDPCVVRSALFPFRKHTDLRRIPTLPRPPSDALIRRRRSGVVCPVPHGNPLSRIGKGGETARRTVPGAQSTLCSNSFSIPMRCQTVGISTHTHTHTQPTPPKRDLAHLCALPQRRRINPDAIVISSAPVSINMFSPIWQLPCAT